MKILLVKPYGVADELIPPLSLGWIATQVRARHEVVILDAMKERFRARQVADLVNAESFDLVGFQAWTKDIHEIRETCELIKKTSPVVITVVGGIQPTMQPVETLNFFGASMDFAWQGEAEKGFGPFVDAVAQGVPGYSILSGIPGLVWRNGIDVMVNQNQFIDDLDAVGLPAWDLMPPNSYPKSPHGAFYRNFPLAPIVVTRGCPFPCRFCSAREASGARLRSRSIDSVLGELALLHDRFGIREFQIEDDNFTLSRDYVRAFCDRLIAQGLNMTWSFPNGVRLDTLDSDTLSLMRKAGCYALNFGVESGSPRILEQICKKSTAGQMRAQIEMAKNAGFDLGGFFIIGFPGETRDEIEETIQYANSLPLDRIGVSYFQPFPGTSFFNELVASGEISVDWGLNQHTSLHDLTYVPRTLTKPELAILRRRFLTSFYFRPKILLGMLKQVNTASHLFHMLKRSARWLKA
jgi:radical SAM superfamily enzyme YgiQ (UPF0313 family)